MPVASHGDPRHLYRVCAGAGQDGKYANVIIYWVTRFIEGLYTIRTAAPSKLRVGIGCMGPAEFPLPHQSLHTKAQVYQVRLTHSKRATTTYQ